MIKATQFTAISGIVGSTVKSHASPTIGAVPKSSTLCAQEGAKVREGSPATEAAPFRNGAAYRLRRVLAARHPTSLKRRPAFRGGREVGSDHDKHHGQGAGDGGTVTLKNRRDTALCLRGPFIASTRSRVNDFSWTAVKRADESPLSRRNRDNPRKGQARRENY